MFEVIGIAILSIVCICVFLWGLVAMWAGGVMFGSRSCLITGLVVMALSSYGLYEIANHSSFKIVHVESTKQ